MIRVANAPCSWGAFEFDGDCPPAPYPQVLDEMRAAGYDGTELGDWGYLPTEPEPLAHALSVRHLQLVGAFVPVRLADLSSHERGAETAVRTAQLMRDAGAREAFVVLSDDNASVPERERNAGRITPALSLSADRWKIFAAGADRIARDVREHSGLRTVFHPHCGGYVEAPWEIDELMARTDRSVLGLLVDTGHILYGGGDPRALTARHADRIWHVHFKDCDLAVAQRCRAEGLGYLTAVRQQLFCELGRGSVDFTAMRAALAAMHYDGWIVVEQDVFPGYGTPLDSARRNRAYLRTLGL